MGFCLTLVDNAESRSNVALNDASKHLELVISALKAVFVILADGASVENGLSVELLERTFSST